MKPVTATYYFKDAIACTTFADALVKYAVKPYLIVPRHRKQVMAQVRTLMYANKSDQAIIANIINSTNVLVASGNAGASTARTDNRTDVIADLVTTAPGVIIDYGCGDGTITRAMEAQWPDARLLGVDTSELPPCAFDGIDGICSPIPYANNVHDIADGTADLVTAFVSLHHMHGVLDNVLSEMRRVLKPGGQLIIREHDLAVGGRRESMRAFLQLVHILYDTRAGTLNMAQLIDETRYYSRDEWDKIIQNAGFELVRHIVPSIHNPQGIYHALYMRV